MSTDRFYAYVVERVSGEAHAVELDGDDPEMNIIAYCGPLARRQVMTEDGLYRLELLPDFHYEELEDNADVFDFWNRGGVTVVAQNW